MQLFRSICSCFDVVYHSFSVHIPNQTQLRTRTRSSSELVINLCMLLIFFALSYCINLFKTFSFMAVD